MKAMTNLAQVEVAMVKARAKYVRAKLTERNAMAAYHRATDRSSTAALAYGALVEQFEQAAHAAKQAGV